MSIKMMMSLDLKAAGSYARTTFDDEMKKKHWVKSTWVSTTWTATFTPTTSTTEAIRIAKQNVADAAVAARIYDYAVVCLPSDESPSVFGGA